MTSEASPPSVTAQSVYAELHADEGDAGGALTRVPLAEVLRERGRAVARAPRGRQPAERHHRRGDRRPAY